MRSLWGVLKDNRGFLQFLPAAIAAGKGIYDLTKGQDDSRVEGVNFPEFFEDPIFADLQNFMQGLGKDILGGNIPEYYAPIGERGGKEFQDVLGMGIRDIQESAINTAAITGRGRGGSLPGTVSKAVGDFTKEMSFADFLRAMQGREFLFGQGRGITENTRNAAFNNQGARNNFNIAGANFDFNKAGYLDKFDIFQDEQQGEAISNVLSSVGGGIIGAQNKNHPFLGGLAGALGGLENLPGILDILDKDVFGGGTAKPSNPGVSIYGAIGDDEMTAVLDKIRKGV